jgi:hypothetical protein
MSSGHLYKFHQNEIINRFIRKTSSFSSFARDSISSGWLGIINFTFASLLESKQKKQPQLCAIE